MRLVIISDTHTMHDQLELPEGDVLIHCGDFTSMGRGNEVEDFLDWFMDQNHLNKILVCGNHELDLDKDNTQLIPTGDDNYYYLENESVIINDVTFHGFPYTPPFYNWAFMRYDREMHQEFKKVPKDVDVMISHGPPLGHLDKTEEGLTVGSPHLTAWAYANKPKLVCFGHIHEGYGQMRVGDTDYINASVCNRNYKVVNAPVVYDI